MSIEDQIADKCSEIEQMLVEKNRAYGNSATEPLRIFSQVDSSEGIRIRIDDKLSRIRNRAKGEDSIKDLVGYLILLMIVEEGM